MGKCLPFVQCDSDAGLLVLVREAFFPFIMQVLCPIRSPALYTFSEDNRIILGQLSDHGHAVAACHHTPKINTSCLLLDQATCLIKVKYGMSWPDTCILMYIVELLKGAGSRLRGGWEAGADRSSCGKSL